MTLFARRAPRGLSTSLEARRSRRNRRPLVESLEDRTVLSVTVSSSFAALDFNHSGGYTPPDTNGAVGPSSYVETVNQQVSLYTKAGVSVASTPLSTFWFTTGGLAHADSGSGLSDPIVTYNDQIGRFIVGDQDVNFTTHVSTFDIAVSKTSTPAGLSAADWTFYRIVTTQAGFDADYPGNFGYNHDAFVFTLNMFSTTGGAGHVQVVSVNNTDLQNGAASPGTFSNNVNDFSLRPTTMHDSVAGDPMWLVTEHGDNASIDVVKVTNVLSSAATFTYTNVPVTAYSPAVFPLNPNGTNITNNMDSRILKSAESNHTIVAAHTVSTSATQDVVQWYAFDVTSGTPTLKDQGRVGGANSTYAFFPSIDINASGQIGLTYMKSGNDTTTDYMSMYVTGRIPTDPAGTVETPVLVPAGTGLANYKDFSSGGRAGDLSGLNLDPTDGSFWAANEFANTEATANWGTAVAHFTLASALPTTDVAVAVTGPSSLNVSSGATNATYTITVTNNGPNAAQGVVLTDTLPAGTTFVSLAQASGTDGFTLSNSGTSATATATGTLASGATDTFTLVVSAPSSLANGSTVTDTASVTASNPDSNTANNTATTTATVVNTATNSDVAVTLSAPGTGTEGGTITYTITVTNSGPVAASGVVVTDTLNPQLLYKSATTTAGTFSQSGGVVTFNIGSLAVGGTVTATVVVQDLEEGALSNNVSVTSTSPDPNTANNAASAVTSFAEPAITVSGPRTSRSTTLTNYAAATFTHASGVEAPGAFVATIAWGDGKTSTGTITLSGTTYTVTGSHTYTSGGRHTITTTVVESGSAPNSSEIVNDKGAGDHPGQGKWNEQDVVKLPSRYYWFLLHHPRFHFGRLRHHR